MAFRHPGVRHSMNSSLRVRIYSLLEWISGFLAFLTISSVAWVLVDPANIRYLHVVERPWRHEARSIPICNQYGLPECQSTNIDHGHRPRRHETEVQTSDPEHRVLLYDSR